jgi:hypothetical protein
MDRTTTVLLCLVIATGCYDSHLGTLLDAGPLADGAVRGDGAIEGGAGDGAIADAGVVPTPGAEMFVISSLSLPEPSAGMAPGADLDGLDSGGGSDDPLATCESFNPDFVAPDGTRGVDDAMGQLVPSVRGLVPGTSGGIDAALADAIRSGTLLLGVQVSGSTVSLFTLEAPTPMEVDAEGKPAPDQRFAIGTPLATGRATVAGTRMRVQLGTIEIPPEDGLGLVLGSGRLDRTELRFTRGTDGLRDGELGASAEVEALVDAWVALVPGIGPAARELLTSIADLDPRPDQPIVCQSVSLGMIFEAVPATFVR